MVRDQFARSEHTITVEIHWRKSRDELFETEILLNEIRHLNDTQGPKVQQNTKEQKMQAALAGGKAKKKKWNKGKMREKINAKVLFDEDGWNRLQAEVPKVS